MIYRSMIDGQSGANFIAEAVKAQGPMANPAPVPAEILAAYKNLVPGLVLDLWQAHGIGDLDGGRLRLCIPGSLQSVVNQLFEGDPYLGGDTYALAFGAFGDLVAWNARHQMVYVNMQLSSVDVPALVRPSARRPDDRAVLDGLLGLPAGMLDAYDANGQPMFEPARERYGELPDLHIYGMFPPAPKDEPFIVENHRITDAEEWLSFKFSDSAFQLADMDAGRFGLRRIGPLTDGEILIEAGGF